MIWVGMRARRIVTLSRFVVNTSLVSLHYFLLTFIYSHDMHNAFIHKICCIFNQFIELTLDDSDEEEEEPAKTRAVKRARRKLDENTIDAIVRVEAKMRDPSSSISLKKGFKPDERRRQEMHYLQLWKEARAELRGMRQELANETDEEVVEELRKDMAGLKKRKEELAKFLGIEEDAISDDADTSGEVGVVKQEIDEAGEVKQEMSV